MLPPPRSPGPRAGGGGSHSSQTSDGAASSPCPGLCRLGTPPRLCPLPLASTPWSALTTQDETKRDGPGLCHHPLQTPGLRGGPTWLGGFFMGLPVDTAPTPHSHGCLVQAALPGCTPSAPGDPAVPAFCSGPASGRGPFSGDKPQCFLEGTCSLGTPGEGGAQTRGRVATPRPPYPFPDPRTGLRTPLGAGDARSSRAPPSASRATRAGRPRAGLTARARPQGRRAAGPQAGREVLPHHSLPGLRPQGGGTVDLPL